MKSRHGWPSAPRMVVFCVTTKVEQMTVTTELVELAKPHTDEWYEIRNTGLGGSDAAAAAGLSEYRTPRDVYHEKRNELPPREETDAMRLGTLLEPVIRSEFQTRTGIQIVRAPMGLYRSPEHEFMLGTPDALCEDDAGLECKATMWRRAQALGLADGDQLPESCADWICQCQHYMSVFSMERWHVAVLVDGRNLKTYVVHRHERLIDSLIAAERELWERIQNSDPPELNWQHPRAVELARELFGTVENDTRIDLSADAAESVDRYEQAGRLIRRLEKRRKEDKAKFLMEIGDNFAGVLPGAELMVRRKRIQADVKAHSKDYVDVRIVNYDGGTIQIPVTADDLQCRYDYVNGVLVDEKGFHLLNRSEGGSWYYRHTDGHRVRVSDHAPNQRTRGWMKRESVASIRLDRAGTNAATLLREAGL